MDIGPKVLWPTVMLGATGGAKPGGRPTPNPPATNRAAPPVYRPQQTVLRSPVSQPGAPPVYRPLQTLLRSPVGNPGAPRVYHPQQIVLRSPTPCAGVTPAQRVLRPMIERHSIPGNPVRPQAHVAPQYSRGKSAPIQRMRDDSGKRVLEELTSPSWQPLDKENTWRGKKAITGAELNTLLRGAAIAAWKTY